MSMGPHHSVVVLAFFTLFHSTVANYEWTGKEWRWVSQKSSSRDDEDLGSGYGLPDDEEEEDGQEPPGGLVENMVVVADQSTITISWQPPRRETWNSCLLGYQLRYRKENGLTTYETVEGTYEDKESGKDYFFEEVEGTNHSYVIRDLDSESTYTVGVQVFNPWGKDQMLVKELEVTTEPGIHKLHDPKMTPMFRALPRAKCATRRPPCGNRITHDQAADGRLGGCKLSHRPPDSPGKAKGGGGVEFCCQQGRTWGRIHPSLPNPSHLVPCQGAAEH